MSVARAITSFTEHEIQALFYKARTVVKQPSIEIRSAQTDAEFGRILIVLPRAVGTAPERNLIKRRLKAIFYQEKWYEKKIDLIVLVRKGATKFTFHELETLLEQVFTTR
jgi:ribonuclease P protein component